MKFQIIKYQKLTSTQDKAKEIAKEGQVIVSEVMTQGRGRQKRKWSANKGGLYLSILLKPKKDLQFLVFKSAIAVCDAIRKYGLDAKLKWPNDVIFNNKKLCGILLESNIKSKINYVIIGIGINVSNKIPKQLTKTATSLKKELNKNISKNKLLKEILTKFNKTIELMPERTIIEWKKRNGILGKKVKVRTIKGEISGLAVDIDKDCNLLIKQNNGRIKKVMVGDVWVI